MMKPNGSQQNPRAGGMRSVARLLLAALGLASLTACVHRPDYVLDDDRMTRVLLDVHRAEALLDLQAAQYKDDAQKRDVMGAVLVRNGVSREQYDSSLVWYGQHLKNLIRIYDRVADSLKAEHAAWQALIAAAEAVEPFPTGDSVRLWRPAPYAVLDAQRLTAFRSWCIPTDSTFRAGDSVAWRLRLGGVTAPCYAVVSIAWAYEGDSVHGRTEVVRRDTLLTLGLAADSTLKASALHLSLAMMTDSLPAADDRATLPPIVADSIDAVRLHRP